MALLCFAWLLSYAFVLDGKNDLDQLRDLVLYKSDPNGIPLSEAEGFDPSLSAWYGVSDEYNSSFVCWNEIDNQDIYQHGTSRGIKADVVVAYGDLSLLIQNGQGSKDVDSNSCVISSSVSRALFGSSNATGLQVEYGGVTFIVRSVVPIDDSILILSAVDDSDSQRILETANAETGKTENTGMRDNQIAKNSSILPEQHTAFDKGSFRFAAVAGSESYIQQFTSLYQLHEDSSISTEVYLAIGVACSALPPLCLLCVLIVYAIKLVFKNRSRPGLCILLCFGSGLFVALSCLLFCSVSSDMPLMLPNRWSDFIFWENLLVKSLDAARAALFDYQMFAAFPYWASAMRCVLGLLATIMAFFGLIAQGSVFRSNFCNFKTIDMTIAEHVFIEMLGISVIEVVVLVVANCLNLTLANWYMMTYMLPVFALGVSFLRAEYFDGG